MWNKPLMAISAIGAWLGLVGILLGQSPALEVDPDEHVGSADHSPLIRADLRIEKSILRVGVPVWAEFSLVNLTGELLTLQVPDMPAVEPTATDMGLPIEHIFSGPNSTAITIKDIHGDLLDEQMTMKPKGPVPIVRLAPFGTAGVRMDLTQYYQSLQQRPGKYTLVWRPYGGTVESPPVSVSLMAEQQAIILTDFGKLIMRFYYNEAPNHVQNFIELVNQRFYEGLTFHRIVPGGIIQGGDPHGDGKGTRTDGKRVAAEFSKIPFELGTVGMARSPKDPDSASCQFYICLGRQTAFDGEQTAFAYLYGNESFETLRKLAAAPTGPKDLPRKPVYMRTVSLENVPAHEGNISSTSRPATAAQKNPHYEAGTSPRKDNVYKLRKDPKSRGTETAPGAADSGG